MEDQFSRVTRRKLLALAGATALAGSTRAAGTRRTRRDVRSTGPRQSDGARQTETVRAYVGSFHWGYVVLDEEGTELDRLTLSSGDELRLTLFNVEADDAIGALPRAVRTSIPGPEERARRNEQAIPAPRGTTLETLHEAAEATYPDHSLVILGDEYLGSGPRSTGPGDGDDEQTGLWGGHHGPRGGPYGPGAMPGYGPETMPGAMPGYGPETMPGYGPGMCGSGWGMGYGETLAPPVYLWHHSTVPSELGFVADTAGSFGFACTVYCGYGHPYMAEPGRVVVNER